MMTLTNLPSLSGIEETRKTLHAYSKVFGMVPRVHAQPHPKWWHVAFSVSPNGLVTRNMPNPQGGLFHLRMDIMQGAVVLVTGDGEQSSWDLTGGISTIELGEKIFSAVADLGLDGKYDKEKYDSPIGRLDPAHAAIFWQALVKVEQVLRKRWNNMTGTIGPLQLWPHGFDMAFEWFGTRTVEYDEGGEVTSYPSQINLGWSPGDASHPASYFFSNPWPFDSQKLTGHDLPSGARWVDGSWQGSLLPYESLVGDAQAGDKVLAFAGRVFELAAPLLLSNPG
jgi:hypothetical protein